MLVVLHGCALWALLILPPVFLCLIPLLVLSAPLVIAKHGLLLLQRSPSRIWLSEKGWYLRLRNQQELGPFTLGSGSRLGSFGIRLSLRGNGQFSRHIILTRAMIGGDDFRRLQVFLRWSADVQKAALPS